MSVQEKIGTRSDAGDARAESDSAPLLIVSTDSHVGPSEESFRPYVEHRHLAEFDESMREGRKRQSDSVFFRELPEEVRAVWDRQANDGAVNDPVARLGNMDADGIASEVIFFGTSGRDSAAFPLQASADLDLQGAGKHVYNRWLVDFCSTAPTRLLGVAELPHWDIEASLREVKWAADAGLRNVNFAAPAALGIRQGIPTYDDPAWEPFFAAVEDLGMVLNCHSGAVLHQFNGIDARALWDAEHHYVSRLPFAMLTFGGVFERHPGLRVVFNEQRGYWVRDTLRELDSIYRSPLQRLSRNRIPRSPMEYWSRHCFVGGSFLARFELEDRHEIGIETLTWGRDYPHLEGTWPNTTQALRHAFAGMETSEVRQVLGLNAARCYGLDVQELEAIAGRVGLRPSEIDEPLEHAPQDSYSFAFRDLDDAPGAGGARFGAY